MYYEYFKLKEHPFRLTCEPKYFYLSPEHAHAKAMMEYALIQRHGIMVLTGEIGSGKTMLIEHFLGRLDNQYLVVKINQTQLPDAELLQSIANGLGNNTSETRLPQLIQEIFSSLKEIQDAGKHTIIMIDEAQHLDSAILASLHALSQQKVNDKKLCTIYLVGQNELRDNLEVPELKEIIKNINSRYHLGVLNITEIKNYIFHRLAVAGGHKTVRIKNEVFPIIETYTGGRPRLINVLTDHLLTYCYLEEISEITPTVIDDAIEDLQWLPFGVRYGEEIAHDDSPFSEERRQSYKLQIKSDNKIRGEFFIKSKHITIGRHRDNDLRIDDALLSRQHAQIPESNN